MSCSISDEQFIWHGMMPLAASVNGEYPTVDLSTGSWDNRREWEKLVNGDEQATLWLPPFCLLAAIQSQAYVVIKLTRDYSCISLSGSCHQKHDLGMEQKQVTLTASMQITKRDRTSITLEYQDIITLELHENQSEYDTWISFWDIPWTELDSSNLPRVSISLAPVKSSELHFIDCTVFITLIDCVWFSGSIHLVGHVSNQRGLHWKLHSWLALTEIGVQLWDAMA